MAKSNNASQLALLALLLAGFAGFERASSGVVSGVPKRVKEFHNGVLLLNAVVEFPDSPPPPATVEEKLDYLELVLAELEAQLPRKSLFRWLFLDRTRLSSGFEKEFRFSYDSYPYLNKHH
uniref:Uncharacterized protein n=1 Tax=Anopheles farauti TaxID=69004 RepID=A0A182QDM5_9DIPT